MLLGWFVINGLYLAVALWHSCCNLFIASTLCGFEECQECQSVIRLFDKDHI